MRRRRGKTVYLNVYDLSPANDYVYSVGLGVFHSGVEVDGTEYSFASGAGIFDMTPRDAPNARFREALDMGEYTGSASDLRVVIADLRPDWSGESYNVVSKNCNSFAAELCWRLTRATVPAYVNRLAYMGSMFTCCLPDDVTGQAPVGHQGGSGSGRRAEVVHASQPIAAFSGAGRSLGGGGGGSGQASSAPSENAQLLQTQASHGNGDSGDAQQRRELMRQAAMARMRRQQQQD